MSVLILILYGLLFILGVATLPLLSLLLRGVLPGFLAKLPAGLLMWLRMLGSGPSKLYQRLNDEYEIRPIDGDLEPTRNWARFKGVPLALDFERDEQAFAGEAEILPDNIESDDALPGGQAIHDHIQRNGDRAFIDLDPEATNPIRLPLGEKLSEYRTVAGLHLTNLAQRIATQEHGGDTSDLTQKWMVIGGLGSILMGGGFGYVIFF